MKKKTHGFMSMRWGSRFTSYDLSALPVSLVVSEVQYSNRQKALLLRLGPGVERSIG